MRQQEYFEAYLDDYDKIVVYLSKNSYNGESNCFYLRDTLGNIQDLTITSIQQTPQQYNRYILRVKKPLVIGEEYEVLHQHARAAILRYGYIVKRDRFDEEFAYYGNDLGCVYQKQESKFTLWAPTAYRVKLELLKEGQYRTFEMKREHNGIFRCVVSGDMENASYVYLVKVNGAWKETIDPYGIASTYNSKRSVVVDKKRIRIKDYPLPPLRNYCDAIIYETSVRDFTMQRGCGVTYPGSFLGFVEENEQTKAKMTGFSYLKSLGITHVQLMPVMDFGSVDEQYQQLFYNWGYDPVQYFALEGSYGLDPTNAYSRMMEFAHLVESCHKAGIRVNLDVVFNHVFEVNSNALQACVPYYYFQMNEEGELSNGTFCGNDFDSTRTMGRMLIVQACRFLCETYRIDGLRFDLMGILDTQTMNLVYEVCHAINPNIMIYGEGWDMPSMLDFDQRASIRNQHLIPHIAHFSDRFRDVAKGMTSQNEVATKGYCTGATYLIDVMQNCLLASTMPHGDTALFSSPQNVVNYVECHDNMTAWDKMRECCKEDTREVRMLRQIMLLGATLLAQGIPFIHSGQEFARTKHGLHNTYCEKDQINQMDYDRRDRYLEIVEAAKALIEIRKKHDVFRFPDAASLAKGVRFEDIDRQVLIYRLQNDHEEAVVIFNPTASIYTYRLEYAYRLLFYNCKIENEYKQDDLIIDKYATIVLVKEK